MAVELPFGSEFSPTTVALRDVLESAATHEGDLPALQAAFKAKYFDATGASESNKRTRAYNLRLSMQKYLLLDNEGRLTPAGQACFDLRTDEAKLHTSFTKHILTNLPGMLLVQCVQDMQAKGEAFSLIKLRKWLADRDVTFPSGGKHASMLKLWLEQAGVFEDWRVNEARLREVLGVSSSEVDAITALSKEQQAYLRVLANIGTPGPHLSNELAKLASATFGVEFDEKNLPKQVLYPLQKAGFIDLERGTAAGGHGAKPFKVTATAVLDSDVIAPLVAQLGAQIDAAVRPLLREPLASIRAKLTVKDKNVKGLALEALAFNLMRLLNLKFLGYRKRGEATGGAEVDLLFQSTRLHHSRWQVQCKNTSTVDAGDIAKEVGLTQLLRSNVIVIVCTGSISKDARQHASKVMKETNLSIILLDEADLDRIEKSPASMVDILDREAERARAVKVLD